MYVGAQVTKGITHCFLAEQTLLLAEPERHIVKLAINEISKIFEEDGEEKIETEYHLVPHSIEVIF